MTVTGDEIVQSCRACFCSHGYGIKLYQKGDILVCPHDASHRYCVSNGMLKKV